MKLKIVADNGFDPADVRLMLSAPQPQAVIHAGRNVLWMAECHGRVYVVKSFCCGAKNRILYRFRRSKARRSFDNAQELLSRGISTPAPVAWAERRNAFGLLTGAWYVSLYDDKMCLRDALTNYGKECMTAFAGFVAGLHVKGIRHDDLNNTNVRVKRLSGGSYSFDLIDLNRMKIYPVGGEVPVKRSMRNLCRFSALDRSFLDFVKAYLCCRRWPSEMFLRIVAVKRRHDWRGRMKQLIKKRL